MYIVQFITQGCLQLYKLEQKTALVSANMLDLDFSRLISPGANICM